MKIIIIVIAAVLIITVLKACISTDKLSQDTTRPPSDKKPIIEKNNDKLILVDKASPEGIKKALIQFCNIYNKDDFAALPRLFQLSNDSFAVTFPYDVDFATFCFAVNFFKYPIDVKLNAQVYGWTTTKSGEDWITDLSADKLVMLYLEKNDKEYDNVFLTTRDNIGYKLGFAAGEASQLLKSPNELFIAPRISMDKLKNLKYEDFE